jgi:hypothetical protein
MAIILQQTVFLQAVNLFSGYKKAGRFRSLHAFI